MGVFGKPKNKDDNFLQERIKTLEQALYYDKLGCYTKYKFDEDFSACEKDFVVFAINVNLEKVNERLGRDEGDKALREITEILNKYFPDKIYHIQGEKFNIFYPISNKTDLHNIAEDMDKTNIALEDYLFCMDYDISIYIGRGECINDTDVTFTKREALDIAVKNMYRDKKIKRPKNKNILREEEENERLKKALEEQKALNEEINLLTNANDLQNESAWLNSFMRGRELAEMEDNLSKEAKIIEQKKKEIEKTFKQIDEGKFDKVFDDEQKYENCIFGYELESGRYAETEERKVLDSMWYSTFKVEFINFKNEYTFATIYIYPLSFVKAPATLPILVVADNGYEYIVEHGKNVEIGIGGSVFTINARFTREGKFSVFLNTDVELVKREEIVKEGTCTPLCFGKSFFGKELFPIKKNVNDLMDCVVITKKPTDEEGEFEYAYELSDGALKNDTGELYFFMQTDLYLEVIKQ